MLRSYDANVSVSSGRNKEQVYLGLPSDKAILCVIR